MRWDYPPLDINPVFPDLQKVLIIIIAAGVVFVIIDYPSQLKPEKLKLLCYLT